jgi:hypothetical protein
MVNEILTGTMYVFVTVVCARACIVFDVHQCVCVDI